MSGGARLHIDFKVETRRFSITRLKQIRLEITQHVKHELKQEDSRLRD